MKSSIPSNCRRPHLLEPSVIAVIRRRRLTVGYGVTAPWTTLARENACHPLNCWNSGGIPRVPKLVFFPRAHTGISIATRSTATFSRQFGLGSTGCRLLGKSARLLDTNASAPNVSWDSGCCWRSEWCCQVVLPQELTSRPWQVSAPDCRALVHLFQKCRGV